MHEEWRDIVGFPGYAVSSTGRVQNIRHDRIIARHVNQQGIVHVSLNQRGRQFRRSVAILVASAFILTARPLSFTTPINVDGDRLNNRADNLLWRPRWYAAEYHSQFRSLQNGIDEPVEEIKTGEVFKCSWEAAVTYGLLDREVVRSIANRTYAIPTYQMFKMHL